MVKMKTNINKDMRLFDVDFLPGKWRITKLGDISFVTKLAGFEYTKHFDSYKVNGEIIVIRGINITNNKLDTSDVKTIPKRVSDLLPRSKLNKGDLTFAYVGTIGPVFLIDQNNKYHLGPNTAKISPSDDVDPRYMFQYFTSNLIRREINENISVGAQPSLSMKKIRSFNIILPPHIEQQKIATALSDMDDLIESLEKIIEKKKKIKQGTMQQLLTGKKRLPGFSGEWKIVKVDDFGSIVTGGTPATRSEEYWNGDIPWVTPTDITNRKNILKTGRMITQKGIETINKLPAKTVLVTCIASIGKNAILMQEGACNQQINAIIPNDNYNSDFLYYLMENNKNYLKSKAGITATNIISKQTFSEIEFLVPNIKEQQAIAEILSDMDAEIEALEEKLKKYKKLKEGMMQELLTGRIRLV